MMCFNTQPPEGGWRFSPAVAPPRLRVSTHSHPKAAGSNNWQSMVSKLLFQHTAARRRLVRLPPLILPILAVSTHSRPKAAGRRNRRNRGSVCRFNTQPPEGGWNTMSSATPTSRSFQHTAARRRLAARSSSPKVIYIVSTHSRPKAAGPFPSIQPQPGMVSTHSRPKAAGFADGKVAFFLRFQHTAARRRLENNADKSGHRHRVSTHSRPKAAGQTLVNAIMAKLVSTHSRPKAAG